MHRYRGVPLVHTGVPADRRSRGSAKVSDAGNIHGRPCDIRAGRTQLAVSILQPAVEQVVGSGCKDVSECRGLVPVVQSRSPRDVVQSAHGASVVTGDVIKAIPQSDLLSVAEMMVGLDEY